MQKNVDPAIAALDLLCTDTIRKRDERIAIVAENAKAVNLHQAGRADEALDLVIPSSAPTRRSNFRRSSLNWAHEELDSRSISGGARQSNHKG